MPHKKPINQDLSEEKKKANKIMSQKRIFVEHSIGGLKRYRILSDRLRIHDKELYNSVLVVCAGLWNFNLKY
ncbi:MAG: transposase family protein [Microscillaceae bacterium]|nr:transposase family protein [Microscillaceae bacterium]